MKKEIQELTMLAPLLKDLATNSHSTVLSAKGQRILFEARNLLNDYLEDLACSYILKSIGVKPTKKLVSKLRKEFTEGNYHWPIEAVISIDYSLFDPDRELINRPEIDELYTLEHYQEFAKQIVSR